MLNTEHSDINFLTFPSKDHSKTKGHVYILIMGEFSLAKMCLAQIGGIIIFLQNKLYSEWIGQKLMW